MSFWDNPQMVINHIRHSCVTSDDTGMCEMVIVQDEPDIFNTKQKKRIGMINIDEGGEFNDYSQSFDIAVSPGVFGRTPKTNQHKLRRKPEHHCRIIHWNDQLEEMSESEKSELFEEKIIAETETKKANKQVSLLSQLLEDSFYEPSNPYIEYAKYDGEGLEDTCPTKLIEIFLSFLPTEEERLQVMSTRVIDTATVRDTIGLVLYKSCLEGRENRILRDVSAYALYIAEDDGTVDTEFPALDEKDSMSKFEFQYLAVEEKDKQQKQGTKNVSVKIHLQNNGYSIVKVDRTDVLMRSILTKILKKRGLKKPGQYQLEKEGELEQYVDLDASLESTGTLNFTLIKVTPHSGSRKTDDKDNNQHASSAQAMFSAHTYKSYQVLLLHRLTSTEVSLGIHGQKIEIDPVAQNKPGKFWTKIKPISLDFDSIAECEITDEKPNGRANFRIYYKKCDDFKHYEFETSTKPEAHEIVKKICNILKTRSQSVRMEFLNSKKSEKLKRR